MNRVAEFAASKLGCGYVYGATGWVCSKARREQQAKQYPEYAGNILGVCAKWDGLQCYDCAQLTRYAAKAAGVTLPSGATSQWRSSVWEAKGEIVSMPDEPGILLYRQSGETMQHTGVYVGGGFVVEARGSSQGVIRSALSSYGWTHWGKVKIDEDEGANVGMGTELYTATVTKIAGANGETVNLRDAPGGDRIDRVPFGTVLPIYEDRDGWSLTQYNGAPGWVDARFIARIDATDSDGSHTDGDPEDGDEMVEVSRAKLDAIYVAIGELLEVFD